MPKSQIHSKVGGAGIGGALSIIIVWLLKSHGYTIPTDVAGAITTLMAVAVAWLATS